MKLDPDFLERVGAGGDRFVPPHPYRPQKGYGLLKSIAVFRRNIIATFRARDFESRIVRQKFLSRTFWLFNTPEHIREALHLQHEAFQRKCYARIDEITEQFPGIKEDKILKSLLPLVPLAFLKPPKKGSGFESLVKDPRVVGATIAGAVAIYRGMNPVQAPKPSTIRIGPATD